MDITWHTVMVKEFGWWCSTHSEKTYYKQTHLRQLCLHITVPAVNGTTCAQCKCNCTAERWLEDDRSDWGLATNHCVRVCWLSSNCCRLVLSNSWQFDSTCSRRWLYFASIVLHRCSRTVPVFDFVDFVGDKCSSHNRTQIASTRRLASGHCAGPPVMLRKLMHLYAKCGDSSSQITKGEKTAVV